MIDSFDIRAWLAAQEITPTEAAVLAGGIVLIALLLFAWISGRRARRMAEPITAQMAFLSENLTQLAHSQSGLQGGLSQLAANQTTSQTQIMRTMEERLEIVSRRMGETLNTSSSRTAATLSELQTRLRIIDEAQKKIERLSSDVVGLQDILANKQARGAFGEVQLNDIVVQALPPSAYTFQAVLSNNRRADCLLKLPNPPGSIVIDSKFPLESFAALRNATNENEKIAAGRAFKTDVLKHVLAISERYIIPGDTAESALMFLPSEAVYAELHANFTDVVQKSFEARVWIVSPTTLMATLNTVRAILKDVHIREQAGAIQKEMGLLFKDVERLVTRVDKLKTHFTQAEKDIQDINISAEKIGRRTARISDFELEEGPGPAEIATSQAPLPLTNQ